MSFLYPRLISISRPGTQNDVGWSPEYAGDQKDNETPVDRHCRHKDIPASIQLRREGQKNPVGLPADGTAPYWDIFIPRRALARGKVMQRDIVTDDAGERYQVSANAWDSMGYRLRCMKLEA